MSNDPHDLDFPEMALPTPATEMTPDEPEPQQRRFFFSLRDVAHAERSHHTYGPSTEGFFVHRENAREERATEKLKKAQGQLDLKTPDQSISTANDRSSGDKKSGWRLFGR